MNALKHGMTAMREFLFESDREKVAERYEGWCVDLRPAGRMQEWMARRVATAGVTIERCEEYEETVRYDRAARVDGLWEVDRRTEIEVLADGLARRPAVIAAKLSQSLYGCE